MNVSDSTFPAWPPGFWRRVMIHPGPGWIVGALEDDAHRFHLRIDHAGGRITAAQAKALRHPWTACSAAGPHLAQELSGALLADVAARDPFLHCTHLFDLAVVMAAHAGDHAPTTFDMRVADRVDGRTTAMMSENGGEVLRWQLTGSEIAGQNRDLRQLSQWKRELTARDAERAAMLRRAVFVSGVRLYSFSETTTAAAQGKRMGVCFNYQLPQAESSTRVPDWTVDFSAGVREPLAGFEPAAG